MSGSLDHAVRRVLGMQIVPTLILCVLTPFFVDPASHFRVVGPAAALGLPVGLACFGVIIVVLAYEIGAATPSPAWRARLEQIQRHLPLVIIYLVALNVVAPVLALVSLVPTVNPLSRALAFLLWRYGTFALLAVFVVAAGGLSLALAARLIDRMVLRTPGARQAARLIGRAAAGVTIALCVWGGLLGVNGALDQGPATEWRGEIVRVWGVPGTNLWWADVRPSEPGAGLKRIFMLPGIDEVKAGHAIAGQAVRVTVRPGLLGLPWVLNLSLDRTPQLEPLLALAPTAAAPRRWLVESLLQRRRWTEAIEHTAIHARHYPQDIGFVQRVAEALRAAGQHETARGLDGKALSTR